MGYGGIPGGSVDAGTGGIPGGPVDAGTGGISGGPVDAGTGGAGGGYGGPGYGAGGYGTPGYGAGGYGPGYGGPPPNSYLVWAILATFFCCLPFGIVSIVFAAQVSSKWNSGDFQGAIDSSNKAKGWATASGICGVVIIIVYGIIIIAARNSVQTTP